MAVEVELNEIEYIKIYRDECAPEAFNSYLNMKNSDYIKEEDCIVFLTINTDKV